MPKRKPPRSQRRGRRPTPAPPPPVTAAPVRPVLAPAAPSALPVAPPRERTISRFTARDYTYVRRELVRIVLLASAIFVLIVILSFFLP
jgi:hypothetical protein